MQDLEITTRTDLERLCDYAGRLNLPQLPLFRASADGALVLLRIDCPSTVWPARLIERNANRPTCFLLGADPGVGYPDPAPDEWACAKRLKYWCRNGAAIVHGAGAEPGHYRHGAMATVLHRRLAFIETTSKRAEEWVRFLGCPRTLWIKPTEGLHPITAPPEAVH